MLSANGEKKNPAFSKTIIGAVIVIITTAANEAGYSIGDATGLTDAVFLLVGAFLAMWGRYKATRKIGLKATKSIELKK